MATSNKQKFRVETGSFTPLHWTVVLLALVTALTHLYLYVTEGWIPFLLAGAGFLGAIVLLAVLPDYRKYLYPIGILFTLSQIVGYLLLPLGPLWIGVVDKLVQVLLIVVLGYLTYAAWTGQEGAAAGVPGE